APGVLLNDGRIYPIPLAQPPIVGQPPGDQGLQAQLVSQPDHGTVTLNADGSFSYIPKTDFTGVDTFTYRAVTNPASADPTAGSSSPVAGNIATVTVAVNPPNSGPEAHNDSYSVAENARLVVAPPGVLGNDSGPANQPLIAVLVSGPSDGALTLTPSGG